MMSQAVIAFQSQLTDLEKDVRAAESRLTGPRKQERDKRQIKSNKLPVFNQQFDELDGQLSTFAQTPIKYGLPQHEIDHFFVRMNDLRQLIRNVTALCSSSSEGQKAALLGDNRQRNYQDSEETMNMTNQQLFSEHNQRIASEDAQLDDISSGLGTLTQIAQQQNQKLKYQENLLGELHDNVDVTQDNMHTNVKRVDIVNEETKGGWFSVLLMIALFAVMVIIIATNWLCAILPSTTRNCK